ncbi:NADH-cytochrome b5 reductase-like [Anopheles nili]|uniref:NADH-cytochrome b5 reductase-like n=1 Tax=Anopheles nili TaxID=185578 RepID=UPI00237A0FF1|nr:NADH-cytochrome b5 reductase-like [Anopheles nili]
MIADEDPACCGSGCTNCVLDSKPSKHILPTGVSSVFDRTYKPFTCASIKQETEDVFRFKFRYESTASHDEIRDKHRYVIIPHGCHLFLRMLKSATPPIGSAADNLLHAWREKHTVQIAARGYFAEQSNTVEKYDKNEADLYFSRPYTPISFDTNEGTFDVLIKMEPGGRMTEYLLTLMVGSGTQWKGVYGDFVWKRSQYREVVAFVQGVAIAPVYSTMRAILDDEEDDTRLMLCGCFRNLQNVLLRDELRAMAAYWNFKYAIYLSRRSCTCLLGSECGCVAKPIKYNEPIYDRRLEAADVERLLMPLSERKHSLLVLLCGTESFIALIKTSLEKLRIEHCYTF